MRLQQPELHHNAASRVLCLPDSLVVLVGEVFSAYLGILNESDVPIRHVRGWSRSCRHRQRATDCPTCNPPNCWPRGTIIAPVWWIASRRSRRSRTLSYARRGRMLCGNHGIRQRTTCRQFSTRRARIWQLPSGSPLRGTKYSLRNGLCCQPLFSFEFVLYTKKYSGPYLACRDADSRCGAGGP